MKERFLNTEVVFMVDGINLVNNDGYMMTKVYQKKKTCNFIVMFIYFFGFKYFSSMNLPTHLHRGNIIFVKKMSA